MPNAIAAEASRRGLDIRIMRNGSRGLYWLEPMVEVETIGGRIAYGPVAAADVPGAFRGRVFWPAAAHRLASGGPTTCLIFNGRNG